jgi:hypothetical protein
LVPDNNKPGSAVFKEEKRLRDKQRSLSSQAEGRTSTFAQEPRQLKLERSGFQSEGKLQKNKGIRFKMEG